MIELAYWIEALLYWGMMVSYLPEFLSRAALSGAEIIGKDFAEERS